MNFVNLIDLIDYIKNLIKGCPLYLESEKACDNVLVSFDSSRPILKSNVVSGTFGESIQ